MWLGLGNGPGTKESYMHVTFNLCNDHELEPYTVDGKNPAPVEVGSFPIIYRVTYMSPESPTILALFWGQT